jgi:Cu2+-containing amine oxidase
VGPASGTRLETETETEADADSRCSEYIFYWVLDQSGEIEFETRATGILSTTPIDPDNTDKIPFATRVGNGVLAPYHQHIVSRGFKGGAL